jgi:hypothetical protein
MLLSYPVMDGDPLMLISLKLILMEVCLWKLAKEVQVVWQGHTQLSLELGVNPIMGLLILLSLKP